jgi:hypothetical protein
MHPQQYPNEWPDEVPFNVPGEGSGGGANIDDFEFGEATFKRTGQEITDDQASRQFRSPHPGVHEMYIEGFTKAPEAITGQGFINGQPVSYTTFKVTVRWASIADPGATILDTFYLVPNHPDDAYKFLNVSKKPDGKNPGFMSEKLGHMLSAIGFVYPKGAPIPADARRLGNWKYRRVVLTIEPKEEEKDQNGQPKIDPTTGMPYPPRMQVKLFSYQPSQATIMGQPFYRPGTPAAVGPAPVESHAPATQHAAGFAPQQIAPTAHGQSAGPSYQQQQTAYPPQQQAQYHQPQPMAPAPVPAAPVDRMAALRGKL